MRFRVFAALLLTACVATAAHAGPDEVRFEKLSALADQGHALALYQAGMMLNNGIGTPKQPALAFKRFEAGAEKGDPLAAYKLGCYHAGQFAGVVPVNAEAALRYKRVAAQAGYVLAQLDVGTMLRQRGDVLPARQWWAAASKQGDLQASLLLTRSFAEDAPRDLLQAYALALVAKATYGKTAKTLDDKIEEYRAALNDDQRATAEQQARNWVEGPSDLSKRAKSGFGEAQQLLAAQR